MPLGRRRYGRTGHDSSVAVLGGAAFWRATPDEAELALGGALEAGVNHLDIAPQYGDAEVVVGPLLPPVRDRLFVAGKTLRKAPDGVRAQLEQTLARLQTDHLDLYQLHGVTDLDELDRRSGAAETILAARDEGLCRWVGITGHDLGTPAAQLEALRRWDLDTVMFPVSPRLWADPGYRVAAEALLAECASRDVGVLAIKAVSRRPWPAGDRFATTWYEPWADASALSAGIDFALSTPGVTGFCTPGDLGLLPAVLAAAAMSRPRSEAERASLVQEAADRGDELIFPLAEKALEAGVRSPRPAAS